jgi:signal transduction histidine kinase
MTFGTGRARQSFLQSSFMSFSRSLILLRVAGLIFYLFVGVQAYAQASAFMPQDAPVWVQVLGWILSTLIYLAFGLAFWLSTRAPGSLPSWAGDALVGAQIVLGMMIVEDMLFLVAVVIPFVLPDRRAFIWITIQVALTAGMVALLAGTSWFEPTEGLSHLAWPAVVILTILDTLALQAFAFSLGYIAASEVRRGHELARVNAELQATQELLADSSRMAERLQISRELHDTLGHHLTVLSVNLELVKQTVEGRATEPVQEAQAVTRLLLSDVREVVSTLRDDRSVDLRRALETLVAGTRKPRVLLSFPESLEIRDPSQAHALFRCAQEAITNAVRHAQARNLWIELGKEEDGIVLRARDDGRGAAAVRAGNGLQGMRERLEEIGGRLEIESRPGQGFSLRAWTPAKEGMA